MIQLWLTLFYLVIKIEHTLSCSCMLTHPQQHFCSADFAVLVDVQRIAAQEEDFNGYSVEIKRVFKMTTEAKSALETQLIWTSRIESLCGVSFNYNTKYLVTGRVHKGKARVNICNFVREWATLSIKQRKGFRQLYAKGCGCKIQFMPDSYYQYSTDDEAKRSVKFSNCFWETQWSTNDCQSLFSFCAPVTQQSSEASHYNNVPVLGSNYQLPPSSSGYGECQWVGNDRYRQCMSENDSQYSEVEREDIP